MNYFCVKLFTGKNVHVSVANAVYLLEMKFFVEESLPSSMITLTRTGTLDFMR